MSQTPYRSSPHAVPVLATASWLKERSSAAMAIPLCFGDLLLAAFRIRYRTVWSSQYSQVYLWSRLDQSIRLLSRSYDGSDVGNGDSDSPSVSENGEYIAWRSRATNLVAGLSYTDDTGLQVYLAQRSDGQIRLVSHQENSPQQTVSGSSLEPSISRDGSTIVLAF